VLMTAQVSSTETPHTGPIPSGLKFLQDGGLYCLILSSVSEKMATHGIPHSH